MTMDLASIVEYWPLFLKGFGVTILISVSSLFLSLVSGLVVAAARQSRFSILVWLAIGYIELFRTIPFMIQLFLFFYVLPFYGVRLPAIVVGIIALSAHGCAYYAEIIRGAVQSVPKGQLDSARAAGMSYMQAMRHVIFPQMLGYFLPPATNQAVLLVKESSVTSTITVVEMTMAAQIVQGITFSPIEVFLVISILYWTLCSSISRLGARLEIKLQPFARRRNASGSARLEIAPPAER